MTASEKIAQRILNDAEIESKEIIALAKKEAENIISEGKQKAEELLTELKSDAQKKADAVDESAASYAKLSVRNAVLLKKREEIEKTLLALEQYLVSLPLDEYFDVLSSLAKRYANGEKGVMVLNSNDLKRKSADFVVAMAELNITISNEADDSIVGGFILKYNDIEQNADFKALIAEKKEELTDIVNKELF